MKQQISLRLFVTLAFILLAVVLVTGYSMLSSYYYLLGMRNITASTMEEVARSYVELVPPAERTQFDNFRGYQISEKWNHIPQTIQNVFSAPPAEPGITIKEDRSKWFGPPDFTYFVYRYQDKDESFFVTRHGSIATAPPLIALNVAKSRNILIAISALIAAILGGTLWFLLRRVSKPVASLGQWARSLNSENLSNPPPDFSYPELNDLADLIRTSLSSVQEGLDREHNYLRYASHELRTPIAVIRNNVELQHKIKGIPSPEQAIQQAKTIDRIDRASTNMHHLTETLLWLSKKEVETLPAKELELDRKEIDLKIETSPYTISLPETPAQIILGNLIRNAFQHTWEGCINIQQQGNRVVVTNSQSPASSGQQDLGFGLGLQLTSQLAKRLKWMYVDESIADIHKASITFSNECP